MFLWKFDVICEKAEAEGMNETKCIRWGVNERQRTTRRVVCYRRSGVEV